LSINGSYDAEMNVCEQQTHTHSYTVVPKLITEVHGGFTCDHLISLRAGFSTAH